MESMLSGVVAGPRYHRIEVNGPIGPSCCPRRSHSMSERLADGFPLP
jgi:hypothetical protein